MTVSRNTINQAIADFGVKRLLADLLASATVAATGSAQTDAAALTTGYNIVTAANDTKGVLLPVSDPDVQVVVLNTVSNKILKVYPDAGGTINGGSANAAYSVPAGVEAVFRVSASGTWYVSAAASFSGVTASAAEINVLTAVVAGTTSASKALVVGASKNLDTLEVNLFGFGSGGIEDTITAHAGGTQAAAFALSTSKSVHRITVVGTDADSVKLPAATGSGNVHIVINDDAAQSAQLFAAATETIDGVASATGVAVAAGKRRICVDYAAGTWISVLGA